MKIIHIVAILIGIIIVLKFVPITLWIRTKIAGVNITLASLIEMKLRRVNINTVVNAYLRAQKAGVNVTLEELESHHLAGGRVGVIVDILIKAERVKMDLSFNQMAAADLAGMDLSKYVK